MPTRRTAGFTLIELMISVAVLIILMSLAIALIQFLVGERKLGRRKLTA